jgi:hypothetical protein
MGDARMTTEEWDEALTVAATIWDMAAFSSTDAVNPRDTWYAALNGFAARDVCDAFSRLAMTSKGRPGLSELVEHTQICARNRAAEEAKEERRVLALQAARGSDSVDARLRAFDQAARAHTGEAAAELMDFCRRHHVERHEMAPCAECEKHLATAGPWETRARMVVGGEVVAGKGIDELFAGMAIGSRGGREKPPLATRAFGQEPRVPEPIPLRREPEVSTSTPLEGEREAEAARLADAWEADNTSVRPADLDDELRTRVREIIRDRRAARGRHREAFGACRPCLTRPPDTSLSGSSSSAVLIPGSSR